jgi:hypothetical protein
MRLSIHELISSLHAHLARLGVGMLHGITKCASGGSVYVTGLKANRRCTMLVRCVLRSLPI